MKKVMSDKNGRRNYTDGALKKLGVRPISYAFSQKAVPITCSPTFSELLRAAFPDAAISVYENALDSFYLEFSACRL